MNTSNTRTHFQTDPRLIIRSVHSCKTRKKQQLTPLRTSKGRSVGPRRLFLIRFHIHPNLSRLSSIGGSFVQFSKPEKVVEEETQDSLSVIFILVSRYYSIIFFSNNQG
jgi:hypothetical protein